MKYFNKICTIEQAFEDSWAKDLSYEQVHKEILTDFNTKISVDEWNTKCRIMDNDMSDYFERQK